MLAGHRSKVATHCKLLLDEVAVSVCCNHTMLVNYASPPLLRPKDERQEGTGELASALRLAMHGAIYILSILLKLHLHNRVL